MNYQGNKQLQTFKNFDTMRLYSFSHTSYLYLAVCFLEEIGLMKTHDFKIDEQTVSISESHGDKDTELFEQFLDEENITYSLSIN